MPMARMRSSSSINPSAEDVRRVQSTSGPLIGGQPSRDDAGRTHGTVVRAVGRTSRATTSLGSPAVTLARRMSQPNVLASTSTR